MEKLARLLMIVLLLSGLSCRREHNGFQDTDTERPFNAQEWREKTGEGYPYRDEMLNDLFATDTLKRLSKSELEVQLGPPDRTDGSYLFYEIAREKAGVMTLHSKTLVIELQGDTVKTVRLHQ